MGGIIDNLNPRQREAVEYCGGPQVVLAGAGSGQDEGADDEDSLSRA